MMVDENDLGHGVQGAEDMGRPARQDASRQDPIAGRSPGVLPCCDEEFGCFDPGTCREIGRCMGTLDEEEWTELIMLTNAGP